MNLVHSPIPAYRAVLLILLLACTACSAGPLPAVLSGDNSSSYCSILHVPGNVPPSIAEKAYLGIIMEPATPENMQGAACSTFIRIVDVIDASPADKAGLKADDILISADGASICRENKNILKEFREFIEKQNIGSAIMLEILRDSEKLSLSAILEEKPYQIQPEASHENFGKCTDQDSFLYRELLAKDLLPLFHGIRSGLYYHSNLVHNPKWLSRSPANPYQLKEFTYMLRHPLRGDEVVRETTGHITDISLQRGKLNSMLNYLSLFIDMYGTSEECSDLSFPSLITKMESAYRKIQEALTSLSGEEKSLLRKKAVAPWSDETWNEVSGIFHKIELQKFISAFNPLLSCLTDKNLSLLQKDLAGRFENTGSPVLYEAETEFGRVVVGNSGPNIYREDAALILDTGGNDVYLNNAGGTRDRVPLAVVIDWAGDDHYATKENISQGAGVLGGGVLIDLGGNDTFQALDAGQGTGLFGIGILYNTGGKTVFTGRRYCQGAGQYGIGMLWNNDSETLYQCSEYGQALGLFQSVGMLFDEGGDDHYFLGGLSPDFRDPDHATVSMGQGFGKGFRTEKDFDGISGGIGILVDRTGNDRYEADYFAQGSSYYFGVGILNDLSGSDAYFAGRYAQGAGIHSSVGVLTDRDGDDIYYASFGVSQGMGHDFGAGLLKDDRGNDRYIAGILSQGAATIGGIGVIVDARGTDVYSVKEKGQAYAEDEEGMGIQIDLQPSDDSVSGRGDSSPVRIGVKIAGQRDSGTAGK